MQSCESRNFAWRINKFSGFLKCSTVYADMFCDGFIFEYFVDHDASAKLKLNLCKNVNLKHFSPLYYCRQQISKPANLTTYEFFVDA